MQSEPINNAVGQDAVIDADTDSVNNNVVYQPSLELPPAPETPNKKSKAWRDYIKVVKDHDYLCDELNQEIDRAVPLDSDIDREGKRNVERLSIEFNKIFRVGRCFLNFYQLLQMVRRFADVWGFDVASEGYSVKCCYAPVAKKKKPSTVDTPEKRKHDMSIKESVQCTFHVKTSPVQKEGKSKAPTSRPELLVRITAVNADHKCSPGILSQRIVKYKNGSLRPDLLKLGPLLQVIKAAPQSNAQLRELLTNFNIVPNHLHLGHNWLRNFRARVNLFELDNVEPLSDWESMGRPLAADEVSLFDSTMNQVMMKSFMSGLMDSEGWEVMQLLEKMKKALLNFDYRIAVNKDGKPTAAVWMTHEMKARLLRYATVIFLDAQKRQFNNLNWPYIGPVVLDNECRVGVIAESLVLSECEESYKFVLKSIFEMVPEFDKDSIHIVFSDPGIMPSMLTNLGLEDAHLFWDNYHVTQLFIKSTCLGTMTRLQTISQIC
jgi:hypothetical protein